MMIRSLAILAGTGALGLLSAPVARSGPADAWYPVVDTSQDHCYLPSGEQRDCAETGMAGVQDAQHQGRRPSYVDHQDGTVSDTVTGLMWAKAPSSPMPFAEAAAYARRSHLGGHSDWRVPSIRELFSLIDYRGGYTGDPKTSRPYIDTAMFGFAYGAGTGLGDAAHGARPIDVQEWSATRYVGLTMGRDATIFGVNFADGRIKGYPLMDPANRMRTPNRLAVRLVRGRSYGINAFDVGGVTVTDHATGLVWQRADDGRVRTWGEALAYCSALDLAGARDWRLPNAKELHSIVDYTRIPAIDPAFRLSDPRAYVWSATTHLEGPPPADHGPRPFDRTGQLAIYAAIGPAMGKMEMPPGSGRRQWTDVHGAGAMRSDPKADVAGRFPDGFGPQGDDIRGRNLSLCVRSATP